MHILLLVLSGTAGLIYALIKLDNSGVDLNSYNPFLWHKRRKWANELGTLPIHRLESSIEAATVLVVATATLEGEVTKEQKVCLIGLFITEFDMSPTDATEAYRSASFMLKDITDIKDEVKKVLAPHLRDLTEHHKTLIVEMMNKVAVTDNVISSHQADLIDEVQLQLGQQHG